MAARSSVLTVAEPTLGTAVWGPDRQAWPKHWRGHVLNVLARLKAERGLAYLFISHDLSVVEHICDRVLVLHHGVVVENGSARSVFENPHNEYTKSLVAAVPVVRPWAESPLERLADG